MPRSRKYGRMVPCKAADNASSEEHRLVPTRTLTTVVESVTMLLVFAVILVTFLVDIAYALADPRLRRRG